MFSMTGFGEGRGECGTVQISVEIKTVNHRFLDLNWRLPAPYQRYELELARLVRDRLKRGRVDLSVTRSAAKESAGQLHFHEDVFRSYLEIAERMVHIARVRDPSAVLSLLPGIASRREVIEGIGDDTAGEDEFGELRSVTERALERLVEMRQREGNALDRELRRLLTEFERCVDQLNGKAELVPRGFQERLRGRLEKLAPDIEIDPSRLAAEVAILADRTDVTEELTRLRSHIGQFQSTLREAECGRKLEFLLQELGREINTTGSKAQHVEISPLIVESKALLEKMREQVLNIE